MAQRLPAVLWNKAEYLAIEKGLTLEQIESATGISLSALKKRSVQGQWGERRRAKLSISEKLRLLADQIADRALTESASPAALDGLGKVMKSYTGLIKIEGMDELAYAVDVWDLICAEVGAVDPEGAAVLRRHTAMLTRKFMETFGKGAQ